MSIVKTGIENGNHDAVALITERFERRTVENTRIVNVDFVGNHFGYGSFVFVSDNQFGRIAYKFTDLGKILGGYLYFETAENGIILFSYRIS